MTDLLVFLRARLDDTERVAREALNHPGKWNAVTRQMEQTGLDDGVWSVGQSYGDERHIEGIGITIYDEGGHNEAQAKHIAEHDPARELREVEVKRRIIALHPPRYAVAYRESDRLLAEAFDHDRVGTVGVSQPIYDPELRLLALPYSEHPDFDERWKP